MPRYRSSSNRDERFQATGDTGFRGVDMRGPDRIESGMVAEAENCRFDDQKAQTRLGINKLPAINHQGAHFPWDWSISFSDIAPFGSPVYGVGRFSDPHSGGQDWVLVAAGGRLFRMLANNKPASIPMPDTVDYEVSFVQCFNKVILFRGPTREPWEMEKVEEGFKTITQQTNEVSGEDTENPTDGTEQIPNADHGVFFQNRLFIPHDEDLVSVSDYLNYTRYLPVRSQFKVNQGSADDLVTLKPIGEKALVCFKTNSIYIIRNLTFNLHGARLDEVSDEVGLTARRSVVDTGNDLWFLSERGVESLARLRDGQVRRQTQPVSDPIEPWIRRINWEHAHKAVAEMANKRFYLAVPFDTSETNNVVLVYDFVQQAWSGRDTGHEIKDFVRANYAGRRELMFLDEDGFLNIYEHDFEDDAYDAGTTSLSKSQIPMRVKTRGYSSDDLRSKRFIPAEMTMRTWHPKYTIRSHTDGVEEGRDEVTDETKSNTAYYRPFYKQDWSDDNVNDDHLSPHRKDYSISFASGTYLKSGIKLDAHQETTRAVRLMVRRGRYVQMEIENDQGRMEVIGVLVASQAGKRGYMVKE